MLFYFYMNKILTSFVLVSFLVFPIAGFAHEGEEHVDSTASAVVGTVLAQDEFDLQEDLPDPGLTPDSPFYFTDQWFETVRTLFTFGDTAKARRFVALADERLAEMRIMVEREKISEAEGLSDHYTDLMEKIRLRVEKVKDSESTQERVANAMGIHQVVLERVLQQVPDEAKDRIHAALERAQDRYFTTLARLAESNDARAGEIGAAVAKKRITEFKLLTDEGVLSDGQAAEIIENIKVHEEFTDGLQELHMEFKTKFAERFTEALPALIELEDIEEGDFSSVTRQNINREMKQLIEKQKEHIRDVSEEETEDATAVFEGALEHLSERLERDGQLTEKVRNRLLNRLEEFDELGDDIEDKLGQNVEARGAALDRIREARERNLEVLRRVETQVPKEAKDSVGSVIERRQETFIDFEERFPEMKERVRNNTD